MNEKYMKNIKLKDVSVHHKHVDSEPFVHDFLSLSYEYEDAKRRIHTYTIPNICLPFSNGSIPRMDQSCCGTYDTCSMIVDPCWNVAKINGTDNYAVDVCEEIPMKEMTIKEIEKELGHKVKIIAEDKE